MAKRALVLGGGGILGMSWETGVLAGLLEAGIDATQADLVVGTSAGSVVGTQVAQGMPMSEMLGQHFAPREGGIEANMEFDLANLMSVFAKWAAMPDLSPANCAEIGKLALASKTVDEARWVSSFAELVADSWPQRELIVTAVDAITGAFQPWNLASGVELVRAVASSCAVPALFPPVTLNGRRYVDGGVRSGTNADLARGYDAVLMIAPIGARAEGIDPLLGRIARAEAEALRAEGAEVELVFCDAATLEAIGVNRMDGTRRGVTAEAGMRQGRELAARLDAWATAAA